MDFLAVISVGLVSVEVTVQVSGEILMEATGMEASDMEVTDSDQTSFLGQPFIQVIC